MQAFHVGEYLQDELDARGWTTRDCAERMGGATEEEIAIEELALDMLIASQFAPPGHAANDVQMGDVIAQGLAKAFGTSAETWLNLERAYFENRARVN